MNDATKELIPLEEAPTREYLTRCVNFWRRRLLAKSDDIVAKCYIDAYQSVYSSFFGELVPPLDESQKDAIQADAIEAFKKGALEG